LKVLKVLNIQRPICRLAFCCPCRARLGAARGIARSCNRKITQGNGHTGNVHHWPPNQKEHGQLLCDQGIQQLHLLMQPQPLLLLLHVYQGIQQVLLLL